MPDDGSAIRVEKNVQILIVEHTSMWSLSIPRVPKVFNRRRVECNVKTKELDQMMKMRNHDFIRFDEVCYLSNH